MNIMGPILAIKGLIQKIDPRNVKCVHMEMIRQKQPL